jgi:DNA-binding transcriptional ArsR family regulator
MRDEPDVASVAALIGDPSRAAMLAALVDGRALPAGELAAAAGLSLSGASAQLARLTEGGLLTMEREGRHRYYRLAGPQVASALEGLAQLAVTPRRPRARSPAAEALRRARTCYDHLAGELGVTLAQALEERGLVVAGEGKRLEVTAAGGGGFRSSSKWIPHGSCPGATALRGAAWTGRNDGIISPARWAPLCSIGSAS